MSEFPQFFKVNQINKDTDIFTASTAEGISDNVADYDKTTKWESIGSDDTTTESVEVVFKTVDEQEENRTIDRVILIGCNAKLFRIYTAYWNGASYDAYVLKDTVSANAVENHIRTITSTSCGKIKIEMDTTIVADEEKRISEFVATKLIWEATMPLDVFDIKNIQKVIVRRLYSGRGQKINQYDKWAVGIEFRQITQTERNALRDIYDNYSSFIIIAEPYDYLDNYDKPEEFYRVFWKNTWEQKYFSRVKTLGYSIRLSLEEI